MQTAEIITLDCYAHLHDSDADIDFLWGGRDSGKSHELTKRCVLKMLAPDYFRMILVKKTYESIKDAQWQGIKDFVYDNDLDHLFNFCKSPLEITTTINDNRCIARGCDRPEKLKSISNPSHVWYEEGNQLRQEDYETISTTLRTNKAKIQEWFSFNPETKGNFKDFWLYRNFFSHIDSIYDNFTHIKQIDVNGEIVELKYTSTHTTYLDNPYCTPERIARHENLKQTNPYRYQVFTLGRWGNEDNENPFFYSFNKDKHYIYTNYDINPIHPLDISFDFNKDPCTAVVGQFVPNMHEYHIISAHYTSPDRSSALQNLCNEIQRMYIGSGEGRTSKHKLRITGDSAGKQGDADRAADVNRYTKICQYFGISTSQVKVERYNIKHTASRDLCNDILHILPNGKYLFHAGTESLIEEIQATYPDKKGGLDKAKKELGLHALDAWRYLNKFWFAHELQGTAFKDYMSKLEYISRIYKR